MGIEGRADFFERMRRAPRTDRPGNRVPGGVAVFFLRKVEAALGFQRRHGVRRARRLHQLLPLGHRDGDDHHLPPVLGGKSRPKLP